MPPKASRSGCHLALSFPADLLPTNVRRRRTPEPNRSKALTQRRGYSTTLETRTGKTQYIHRARTADYGIRPHGVADVGQISCFSIAPSDTSLRTQIVANLKVIKKSDVTKALAALEEAGELVSKVFAKQSVYCIKQVRYAALSHCGHPAGVYNVQVDDNAASKDELDEKQARTAGLKCA